MLYFGLTSVHIKINVTFSQVLSYHLSWKTRSTVHHKYLEVGHSNFECDSVHSNIENALKKAGEVNLPTNDINIIHSARSKGWPYGVK